MKIASNYAFLFLNKENKTLLGPPPPQKAQGYECSRYGYTDNSYEYTVYWWLVGYSTVCVFTATYTNVCIYQQSVTWYSLVSTKGPLSLNIISLVKTFNLKHYKNDDCENFCDVQWMIPYSTYGNRRPGHLH